MKHRSTTIGYIILYIFMALPMHAQRISGIVTDAENHQPLESVMIGLIRNKVMIDYALTDAKGHYTLSWKYNETLQLTASLLGYRKVIQDIHDASILNINLQPEAIALKEVVIHPGRVYSQKDTIRYDLSEFTSSKDVYIKDVLKKLPGIDIDENGQVKYKGKAIDHYFVEGMDLTGGRYNQINNNLSAKAVKTAEIMENYQSIKALKGKINSDEVALNLKLDPKVRDQWIVNGTFGTGVSQSNSSLLNDEDPTQENTNKRWLWKGTLSGLQLGKGNQSLYAYKTNNNGTDLSNEQRLMVNYNPDEPAALSSFLSVPDINAPLDKTRLLFNETHTLNGNRMYRWNDEQSLRIQTGYTHDRIRQQKQNTQLYYLPDDTTRIDESYHYRLIRDAANIDMEYEDNNAMHYLKNHFKVEGETEKGITPELEQTIRSSRMTVNNIFSLIKNRRSETWGLYSSAYYAYLPASLLLNTGKENFRQHCLSGDNYVSYLKKHNGFTQQYKVGIQGEWNSTQINTNNTLKNTPFDASYLSVYFNPLFQIEYDKMLISLTLPTQYKRYFSLNYSLPNINPIFYGRYQINYHWKLSVYGNINRSAGDITGIYPYPHRTDYRTWRSGDGTFPINTRQSYNLYGEYKNTVQEFFVTAQLGYNRLERNTINEQNISNQVSNYTLRNFSNHIDNWLFSSTISKGIYDWHLKTSLTLQASRNKGKELSNNNSHASNFSSNNENYTSATLQAYRYNNISAEPQLIWSPNNTFEAEYNAKLGYTHSSVEGHKLPTLMNIQQHLHLTFSIGKIDVRLSGEHYRNELGNGTLINTLFADASVKYRKRKWNINATLNNLFNKKKYAYTIYSTTQSTTSQLDIRPREFMFEVGYQF